MAIQKPYENCSFLGSWSGGKDSYLACYKAIQLGAKPQVLLNVMNENGDYSRSHGIPREVMQAQAACLSVPIEFIESTWEEYEQRFIQKLIDLKTRYQCTHAVYGDIDIQSHRDWEEKVSDAAGLEALLPIWQGNRLELVHECIDASIEALIVSCQAPYADHILGKYITKELIPVFESLGIDACGENGEYHTLVTNGPLHQNSLALEVNGRHDHGNYSFLDFRLAL